MREELQPGLLGEFSTKNDPHAPENEGVGVDMRDPRKLHNNFLEFEDTITGLENAGDHIVVTLANGKCFHIGETETFESVEIKRKEAIERFTEKMNSAIFDEIPNKVSENTEKTLL